MRRITLIRSGLTIAVCATLAACTAGRQDETVEPDAVNPTTTAVPSSTEGADPIRQGSSPSPTPAPPAMETAPAEVTGSARPSLVYAGLQEGAASVQMSGVVTNLVEDGGTCTFALRSGSTLVTRAQAGLADASSTSCGTVEIPVTELGRGLWEATLDYAGPGGSGISGIVTVDVP